MLPREQSGAGHGIDADGQFLAGRCLLRGAGNGQKQPLEYVDETRRDPIIARRQVQFAPPLITPLGYSDRADAH